MASVYPIEEIKNRVSVFDFARSQLGLRVDRPGARCVSFRHGARNPSSLLIEERSWHDFGSGLSGDVIDLAMHARQISWHEAVRELAALAGVALVESRSAEVYLELGAIAREFHQNLTAEDRAYLHSRRISDATIDKLLIGRGSRLGMVDRITIPYWKAGRVAYLVGRATLPAQEEKYKKLFRSENGSGDGERRPIALSDHPIWGMDTLYREGPVVIAEGIFDALSCWQEGLPVVTAVTGRFSREQEKDLFDILQRRPVVVCMDYDPQTRAGQQFSLDLARKLFDHAIHARVVQLEGGDKKVDLSELYAGGADLKKLLAGGRDYAQIAIDQAGGDQDKLHAVLKAAARFMLWPDVAKLLAYAKNLKNERDEAVYDKAWLMAVADELKRPPSDDMIVKAMRKKHELLYHEQLGWYQYEPRGVWASRGDGEIRAMIAGELRHFRSGPRIASAFTTAKAEFIRPRDLNEAGGLVNVANGMLDLATLDLRPHDPSYFSSIQLGYRFDPDAECPQWTSFIESVTAGDERRQMFLQELFGYCLTTSTKYQCAFFLIGEGSNGKSVLLDVLIELIGRANVSNVEISSLGEPFQRISLYGKLINVASETESDVKGTETIFKQIVTGDPISGCYKGKDFITFRPTCKMVFASNHYPETSDLSHGFMRRLRFLNFPMRYVDNPDPADPLQAPRDREIRDRLLAELPGILNWSLAGLGALRAQDGFTWTEDQRTMIEEYKEVSNPLMAFYEEYDGYCEWIARVKVYGDYKKWCGANNTRPYSPRKFWPAFKRMVRYEEKGISGDRFVFLRKKDDTAST